MKKLKWSLFLIVFLLAVRAVLPWIGLWVINHELAQKLGTYEGHIEDFDLTLYRGAYQLQGLVVKKKNSKEKPLLKIEQIDLSLAWRALWRHRISADITLTKPEVHFVDSEKKSGQQLANDEPAENWRKALDVLIPTTAESVTVHDGSVDFINRDLKTAVPVKLDQVQLETKDLRLQKPDEINPLKFTARLQEHAPIRIMGKISLLGEERNYDLDFELKEFRVNTVNQVLRAYIPLDITKGELSLYGEVAADNQEVLGYSKVFFKNGDIIAPHQHFLNFRHFIFEIATAFGNWFLKNQDNHSVETVVPFHYQNKKWDISASKTFWSAVKAKKDGLKPQIDHRISLQDLKPRSESKAEVLK